MIGQQIENYLILALLGKGGMGEVWKALDVNLERVVALKVITAGLTGNAELVARFRIEARVQAALNHPNIATMYAFLVWDGKAVMVMEYVEGETIKDLITSRGALPPQSAINLSKQVLLGVEAAHRQGIVHRDLKPANLMLNKAGIVKVMDFGIAKMQDGARLTRTNTAIGTFCYMSPEQIRGQAVDGRSDVYSMGVTLYEMLTGKVPFDFDSDFEIQSAHVNTLPAHPTEHNPNIPDAVAAVVMRALEKNPSDRFANAGEFIRALPDLSQVVPDPTPCPRASTVIEPITRSPDSRASGAGKATEYQPETSTGARPPVAPSPPPVQDFEIAAGQAGQNPRKRNRNLGVLAGILAVAAALGLAWQFFAPHPVVKVATDKTVQPSCPQGSERNSGGVCVSTESPSCPAGTLKDSSGACVKEVPAKPCPGGTIRAIGGSCVLQPPALPECASGEVRNSSGVCAIPPPPPPSPCPSGTARTTPNGTCSELGSGGAISGKWQGTYFDARNQQTASVELQLDEDVPSSAGPDNISGTMIYAVAGEGLGKCSVRGSAYDAQNRRLKLVYSGCVRNLSGNLPAYFNTPTLFSDVSPSATMISKGHVYGQTVTAVLARTK